MKTVYFVRHGESETNAGNVLLGPTAQLTEKGRKQALFIAERCAQLPLDVIISSTYPRAKDTAQAIVDRVHKPIEYSALFIERKQASKMVGKRTDDPEYLDYVKLLQAHGHDPKWRFEDSENFLDLKERASNALRYLEDLSEENILVVTHGLFMRVLLGRVIMGEDLTGQEYQRFLRGIEMENTGLTVLRYQQDAIANPWRLWIWNDHSHLADI